MNCTTFAKKHAMLSIAGIRKEYMLKTFSENEVAKDPFDQFTRWWNEAQQSKIDEVNAMTLATANSGGNPSARIVLLKGFDENGFVFFSNYESHKGKELAENPRACLVFFWKELERQVRITGNVEKIPASVSDEYFASRPRGSQVSAWASPQSNSIAGRNIIEERSEHYREQFDETDIPRPAHWGGYLVKPLIMEFWQGRPNRLHDRIQYTLLEGGRWSIERLAP